MTEWLQNLLHSINPTWVWIGLGYLACLFAIVKLMRAKGMADDKADYFRERLREELDRQAAEANSAGPAVTKKTLIEDRHTNKDKETTE